MDTRGLERFAPLAGAAFLPLAVIAFLLTGEPPAADDPAQEVVTHWTENDDKHLISALVTALAALSLVWFGGALRDLLWRSEGGSGRLATLAFAGSVIAAIGLALFAGFEFVAANTVGDVPPEVTQTLSALNSEFFFPAAIGFALLWLATGLAILRTGVLPRWLGVALIVLAILGMTPLGFFAFLISIVVVTVLAIVLFLRGAPAADGPPPRAAASP